MDQIHVSRGKESLRIAMVCDFFYPRLGGVENHIYNLSQQLLARGHKVIVVTHAYGGLKGIKYRDNGMKVYYCPIIPMTDEDALPTFTATLPLMRRIFIRERIQVVHSHQATSVMANEAIVYASALGIATVYTDHSLFGFDDLAGVLLNRTLQTTLSTVDAAIAVSSVCRENLILRARLDPSAVQRVPNAVHAGKFLPDPSKRTPGRVTVVVVSRLVYRKGVDLLVEIVPRICERFDAVDFLIGGSGSKMLDLQEMVERERLEDRVTFLGALAHEQVRDTLVQGDIFLNCSLTESFCIAILEAACAGLFVVSTNVGGIPEVLPDDMVLLSEPNVQSMVASLSQAINNALAIDEFPASQRHKRIEELYSWHRVARDTISVYDGILSQQRKTFLKSMSCYQSLGGISGFLACCLVVIIHLWLRIVFLWDPEESIPRVAHGNSCDNQNGDREKTL